MSRHIAFVLTVSCLTTNLAVAKIKVETKHVMVSGLKEPVEILKDRWGIAHIYAENEQDLFFAQGYNVALDRLFQLEIWRRQATGTVAEILGQRELERDTGTRLHMFRKNLEQELNHYHPRGSSIIRAFVRGINARIVEVKKNARTLPIEFRLLGILPGEWTPAVVISRHQGLLSNVTRELEYGRAVAAIGADAVRELDWFRPGNPVLELDPVINTSSLDNEILRLYRAFREPVRFEPSDLIAEFSSDETTYQRTATLLPNELSLADGNDNIGSNNWVVAGRFTQSGFPYMVNDPHRTIVAPSLRYFVHLNAPGWNVIGGGEPALPGVSIGHNDYGAWGLTVFGQDNEDLYVYETNPVNPSQYRYLNGWEDMKVISETIEVKDVGPITTQLKYTRHGPVLYQDEANQQAYALRAAWMEIGNAPYLASLRMDQARSWEEFIAACSYSRLPAENMLWADVDKNIGYQAVGISPIRSHWSGLVPVPGDGRYEWEGYLPITALPSVLNPNKGYFATANNYMVPDGYPYIEALHYTWGDEMRAARINELLEQGRPHTIIDMMNYQHDELSIPARNLVQLLREIELPEARTRIAAEVLLDWDFVIDKRSVAGAIYVSFERHLLENLRKLLVPERVRTILPGLNKKRVIDWLVAPDGRFGENPIRGRNAILAKSLKEAVTTLTKKLGPNMTKWQYGQEALKHIFIQHALSAAANDDIRAKLNVGPAPRGGYGSTLNNTGNNDNQTSGASFRIIADTANWDNTIATSAPGQSGDPDSPHYRDLFELFVTHQYFPLFFSRAKIESVTESRLLLAPEK